MQGQYEFKEWPHFRGNISDEHRLETGKALCFLSDPIYGPLILQGKQDQTFSDELIKASIDEVLNMNSWIERQHITHLCCVPSTNNRNLVPEFAKKIASQLNLPFVNCVIKTKDNKPQKTMENTFWQKRNLDGAFSVNVDEIPENSNFLLVDDIVDSRWTLTIIGALLREAGAKRSFLSV